MLELSVHILKKSKNSIKINYNLKINLPTYLYGRCCASQRAAKISHKQLMMKGRNSNTFEFLYCKKGKGVLKNKVVMLTGTKH